VHDVAATVDALKVWQAAETGRMPSEASGTIAQGG